MNLQDFAAEYEIRCNPKVDSGKNDPRLILPRREAFRAMEKARKEGDALEVLYAKTRLDELAAMDWEELS